jgi:hypothetical protein
MDLKDRIANVPIVFVLTTITAGFMAGWTAHSAVLLASGYSAISGVRLQRLRAISVLKTDELNEKLDSLRIENSALTESLLRNRPLIGNSIENVHIAPPHTGQLNPYETVAVAFNYKVNPNESALAWVEPIGNGPLTVFPMISIHGSGHLVGGFTAGPHSEIEGVTIHVRADDGTILAETKLRAQLSYK